jgi:hypothetical protein
MHGFGSVPNPIFFSRQWMSCLYWGMKKMGWRIMGLIGRGVRSCPSTGEKLRWSSRLRRGRQCLWIVWRRRWWRFRVLLLLRRLLRRRSSFFVVQILDVWALNLLMVMAKEDSLLDLGRWRLLSPPRQMCNTYATKLHTSQEYLGDIRLIYGPILENTCLPGSKLELTKVNLHRMRDFVVQCQSCR